MMDRRTAIKHLGGVASAVLLAESLSAEGWPTGQAPTAPAPAPATPAAPTGPFTLPALPYAYDALRLSGAAYLLWLAWQALKPNGRSPFQVKKLAVDGPRKLFAMGFVTNLLNPKIAMLYLALLPQFIDPAQGSVLTQSLALGSIQTVISVSVNAVIALAAGSIALFLGTRPTWLLVQRWLMGTVLAGLALRMALETRRA